MSVLFSPVRLAGLELSNRIVVSPMCQCSDNDEEEDGANYRETNGADEETGLAG